MEEKQLDYDAIINILTNDEKEQKKDRRQRRDWITKMPVFLSLLSWALLATVWILLDQAAPPKSYGWLSFFDGYSTPSGFWKRVPVNVAYILLMVSIGLCLIAFGFNKMRMRRKTDKYKISVFFVGIVSIIALVAFLMFFLPRGIIGNW